MQGEEYIALAARTEKSAAYIDRTVTDGKHRLLHAALGILTEAGELGDAIKKHYVYDKDLNRGNIIEEVGDLLWYVAIICNQCHFTLEEAMSKNIAKLRLRYPEKYTDAAALARADKFSGPDPEVA